MGLQETGQVRSQLSEAQEQAYMRLFRKVKQALNKGDIENGFISDDYQYPHWYQAGPDGDKAIAELDPTKHYIPVDKLLEIISTSQDRVRVEEAIKLCRDFIKPSTKDGVVKDSAFHFLIRLDTAIRQSILSAERDTQPLSDNSVVPKASSATNIYRQMRAPTMAAAAPSAIAAGLGGAGFACIVMCPEGGAVLGAVAGGLGVGIAVSPIAAAWAAIKLLTRQKLTSRQEQNRDLIILQPEAVSSFERQQIIETICDVVKSPTSKSSKKLMEKLNDATLSFDERFYELRNYMAATQRNDGKRTLIRACEAVDNILTPVRGTFVAPEASAPPAYQPLLQAPPAIQPGQPAGGNGLIPVAHPAAGYPTAPAMQP